MIHLLRRHLVRIVTLALSAGVMGFASPQIVASQISCAGWQACDVAVRADAPNNAIVVGNFVANGERSGQPTVDGDHIVRGTHDTRFWRRGTSRRLTRSAALRTTVLPVVGVALSCSNAANRASAYASRTWCRRMRAAGVRNASPRAPPTRA